MSNDKKDNPFFLEADVDISELQKSLTKAEKSYVDFSKQLSKILEGLETQEQAHKKVGEEAKEAAEKEEEATKKKSGWLSRWWKKRAKHEKDKEQQGKKSDEDNKKRLSFTKRITTGISKALSREKSAADSLGISFANLAALIGGVTVVGLIGKAIKDYLEFDSQVRSLNVSMGTTPKIMDAANSSIQELTGYLGVTRDELSSVAKLMGETRMFAENTDEAAKSFRTLTMDVIHLSKSMDVSMDSVVGMFENFTRVYKLPHHRLRNIAASMKYIQEQTSISGQELVSFSEGLDEVISRMIDTTGEGKAKATADLMAMAGVLKDMGVQPQKVSQMFGEAMKLHSEQGAQFLSFITEGTDKSAEQVRRMMQAGDMQTPLTLLIERIKKEGPKFLERNEEWLTEVTGMTFAELRNIQQSSSQGLSDLFERNRKEYARGQKHAEEAQKRQHALSKLWNDLSRVAERVWLGIGKVLVSVAGKVSNYLVPVLQNMMTRLDMWLNDPKGAEAINAWAEKVVNWFKSIYNWAMDAMVPAITAVAGVVKSVVDWWQNLSGTEQSIVKWGMAVGAVMTMLGGKIGLVVSAFAAAFSIGRKLGETIHEITGGADKFRMTMENLRFYQRLNKAESVSMEFKDIMQRARNMQSGKQVAVEELQRFMAQGIIDNQGSVNMNHPVIRAMTAEQGVGPVKALQKAISKSLTNAAKVESAVSGSAVTASGIMTEAGSINQGVTAAPAPVQSAQAMPLSGVGSPPTEVQPSAPPPAPVVKVSTESPKEQRLLGEIRDTLVRISGKGVAHPSRQLLNAT